MSDIPENITPENEVVNQPEVNKEPAVAVEPVSTKPATYQEEHTAKNTTMNNPVDAESIVIRKGEEKDRENGFLNVYLGSSKPTVNGVEEMLTLWLIYYAAEADKRDGRVEESEYEAARNNWLEYIENHLPGMTIDDANKHCQQLNEYFSELVNAVSIRSKLMREEGITNLSDRGSNLITPDITSRKPNRGTKGLSISEVMRRTALNSGNEPYNFDVLLRNSFVGLTIKRPSLLDMGSIIQDIHNTVKGYVREIKHNSIVLSRVAGMRVIWEYIANNTVNCTVKDTNDYRELADSILITDFDALCVQLINATHTTGVNMELSCLEKDCNWTEFDVVDPAKLLQHRRSIQTDEQAAVYANLLNRKRKYSREEMTKLVEQDKYGLETNRVYSADGQFYFEIAPPTLTQAFETFDYFVSEINPKIQELRNNIVDPDQLEDEITQLINQLAYAECIHWISKYGSLPAPDTDEEEIVYKRSETDSVEFNKGLMDIFQDNAEVGQAFLKYLYNNTPLMSHTFVGVDHYHCPECKKRHKLKGGDANKGNTETHDKLKLGYTPIDAYMSFFVLSRLMLMVRQSKIQAGIRETFTS